MDPAIVTELGNNITNSFQTMMSKIAPMWSDLGINGDDQIRRCRKAQDHLISEMKSIIESEDNAFEELSANVSKKISELDKLNTILGYEPITVDDSMALLEKGNYADAKLDALRQELKKRMDVLKQLKKTERKFCEIFCLPPHHVSSQKGVPSEAEVRELEEHVQMLMEKRDRLHTKYCSDRRELIEIMETAGLTPETDFERQALCCEDDEFLLSDDNLKELDAFLAKVRGMKSELEKEKEILVEKAIKLWNRLSISADERKTFLVNCEDCSQSTLKKIQLEIERCETIKRQDIKSYIQVLHDELRELWIKCHISESEQKRFLDQVDRVSEDSLDKYEAEVQRVNEYYKNTEVIQEKIEKWRELWDKMIDFESKANDHQKYLNRGGNLLREEKERKRLDRDFPKLEKELYGTINEYERSSGKQFLFNGTSFETFVFNERQQHDENKRMLRELSNVTVREPTSSNKRLTTALTKSASLKVMKSNTRKSVPYTSGEYSHVEHHEDASSSHLSRRRVKVSDDINTPSSSKCRLKTSEDILSASLKIKVKLYDATSNASTPNSQRKVSGAINGPGSSKSLMKASDGNNVPILFKRSNTPARGASSLRRGLRSSSKAASNSTSSSEFLKIPRSSTPKKAAGGSGDKTFFIRLKKSSGRGKKTLPSEDDH